MKQQRFLIAWLQNRDGFYGGISTVNLLLVLLDTPELGS